MRKELANSLQTAAQEVADWFSNPDREHNYLGERFVVDKVTPLSDTTAIVVYRKDSGKFAGAFFYWVNSGIGVWKYFFPTDSHLIGMRCFYDAKTSIENANYGFNFANFEETHV